LVSKASGRGKPVADVAAGFYDSETQEVSSILFLFFIFSCLFGRLGSGTTLLFAP
jgi:hypothetical protein